MPDQETRLVNFRLTDDELKILDKIVEAGLAKDRTDAIRQAISEAPRALIAKYFTEHNDLPKRLNELGKLGDFIVAQVARQGIAAGVEVLPTSFDITVGQEQHIAARVKNAAGQVIVNAPVRWYVSPTTAGTIREETTPGEAWFRAAEYLPGQQGWPAIIRAISGDVESHDINVHVFNKERFRIVSRQERAARGGRSAT